MRASMHADGTTSCPRFDLVETEHLDSTGKTKVDPHAVGLDVGTTVRWPLGDDQNGLTVLSGSECLNDLVQQGKQMKHVHLPFLTRL